MPVQRRRERYIIIHTFKILKGMAPNDLSLEFYTNNRLGTKLKMAPINNKVPKYASSLMDNSFRVQASRLWNHLPAKVNTAPTLDIFKATLGNYLKTFPDQPPVRGYTTPNRNSLIDWSNQLGGPLLKWRPWRSLQNRIKGIKGKGMKRAETVIVSKRYFQHG